MAAQVGEMPDQNANQFALAIPEARRQLAFFFGGQELGREGGMRNVRNWFG